MALGRLSDGHIIILNKFSTCDTERYITRVLYYKAEEFIWLNLLMNYSSRIEKKIVLDIHLLRKGYITLTLPRVKLTNLSYPAIYVHSIFFISYTPFPIFQRTLEALRVK